MGKIERTKVNKLDCFAIVCVPIIVGIFTCIVSDYFIDRTGYIIACDYGMELLKTIIEVWGILLGFIITAISILMTIGENNFIKNLVESNHMANIILSYVMASVFLLIAIVFVIVLLILHIWTQKILVLFIGANVCICISIGICVYFLFGIALNMNR